VVVMMAVVCHGCLSDRLVQILNLPIMEESSSN
jgi:hypothetical protein